jgi:hypothetical protein
VLVWVVEMWISFVFLAVANYIFKEETTCISLILSVRHVIQVNSIDYINDSKMGSEIRSFAVVRY